MGLGIKSGIQKAVVKTVKSIFSVGSIYNAPRRVASAQAWLAANGKAAGKIVPVYEETARQEAAPDIYNYRVTQRFGKYYQRSISAAYVVELVNGKVYGEQSNYIITPDDFLVSDLSREFGRYGGKPMDQSSLITQTLRLPECRTITGRAAVLSTCGCDNFHHWNYDIIPRVHLLQQAGLLNGIDHFILSMSGTSFQLQSLQLLGIPEERILNPAKTGNRLLQADVLIVPSLPSPLGTVSPWVIDFLRSLYNPRHEQKAGPARIYLSRKKVTSRKVVNNDAFNELLKKHSIVEIFPEDYKVAEMAGLLAGAKLIVSVHGSGLSNLCFISPGTTVIDILAPYHQDGYYWMISNIRHSKYIGFFSEGEHPADDVDLVEHKIDDDLHLDITKLNELLTRETSAL